MVKFRKISGLVLLSAFMLEVNSGHLVSAKRVPEVVSKGTSVPKAADSKTNSSKDSGGNLDAGAIAAPRKEVMEPVTKLAEGSVSKDNKVTGDIPVDSSEVKIKATDVKQGDIGFAQGMGIVSGTSATLSTATYFVKNLIKKSQNVDNDGGGKGSSGKNSQETDVDDNGNNGKSDSKDDNIQKDKELTGLQIAIMVVIWVLISMLALSGLFVLVSFIASSSEYCVQHVGPYVFCI